MTITKMREEIDALNKELNGKMVAVQGENRRPDAEERAWANKKLDAIHDLEDNINFQERDG